MAVVAAAAADVAAAAAPTLDAHGAAMPGEIRCVAAQKGAGNGYCSGME